MKPSIPDAEMNLGMMVRNFLIEKSLDAMKASKQRRRHHINAGSIDLYRDEIRSSVSSFYGDMQEVFRKSPLNMIQSSTYDKDGYRLENVLFDSFPGMQVNATVYVPLDSAPPFPAVIVGVGHSGKQFINYQLPAQFFARSGFLAITFDPPGQSSEKKTGNDHFVDGVRCYPVGDTSSRYFIGDALRCIDYLETRSDVDLNNGVAITGVSGGGTTATFALHLDERITVIGPSCCVTPLADLDIEQCYAGCPETHMFGRYAKGIDEVDLICAAFPRPVLLMAGKKDEVFHIDDTKKLAEEVGEFYSAAGVADRFRFFVDNSGHAYSLEQARQFSRFMNTWLVQKPERQLCQLPDKAFEMDAYEEIRCYPNESVNMRSMSSEKAAILAATRNTESSAVCEAARTLIDAAENDGDTSAEEGQPFLTWMHEWQHVLIKPENGIVLPATFLRGLENAAATILHFDDQHRDRLINSGGPLAQAGRFCDRDRDPVSIFSIDLRGWGDTEPTMFPYEISGWGGIDRYLAYTTAALGIPIMNMRIRDGLAALSYLDQREDVDSSSIIVTGCGLGGIIALHVAALREQIAGTVIWDSLISIESIVAAEEYQWPADTFIPNILLHYDLPDLAMAVSSPVLMLNQQDAARSGRKRESEPIEILNAIERMITDTSNGHSTS